MSETFSLGKRKNNAALAVVPISSVEIKEGYNPRADLGDLTELSASIAKEGIIEPLIVRPQSGKGAKEGHYWIVAGERRYRAAKKAGVESVPCVVRTDLSDDTDALCVSVAENSEEGRTPLTAIELGRTFARLAKTGLSPNAIAARTATNHQKVRRALAIVTASQEVQQRVASGDLGIMAASELATLKPKEQAKVVSALPSGATAQDVKRAVREVLDSTPSARRPSKAGRAKTVASPVWRGAREKQRLINALSYSFLHPDPDENFDTLSGALGVLLWERQNLDTPVFPLLVGKDGRVIADPPEDATAAEKKVYKATYYLVAKFAEDHAKSVNADASKDATDDSDEALSDDGADEGADE